MTDALDDLITEIAARDHADQCIRDALETLLRDGPCDGAHHKAWAIDQAVRKLAGSRYEELIQLVTMENGVVVQEWSVGIP